MLQTNESRVNMLKRNYFQPDPSDEILAARIAQHDLAALDIIYDRFASRVFTLAAMLSDCAGAERIVLQVFSRLWFEANRFNLHGGSFRDWFLDLTRTHILTGLKRQKGRTAQDIVTAIDRWLSEEASSQTLETRDELDQPDSGLPVRQALQDLSSEQRCVVVLAGYGGFKPEEITQLLGWPLYTVQQHASLGLHELRHTTKPELVLQRG